jgi:hypothetical protein
LNFIVLDFLLRAQTTEVLTADKPIRNASEETLEDMRSQLGVGHASLDTGVFSSLGAGQIDFCILEVSKASLIVTLTG